MIPIDDTTRRIIVQLFPAEDHSEAITLLEESCADNLQLPGNTDLRVLDRVRFAVLRMSEGKLSRLQRAVEATQRDWRDVLVAGGFGLTLTAHLEWAQQFIDAG